MALVDRHLKLSRLDRSILGSIKASAANAVYTKQTFASTINATVATGTMPDVARNLIYNLVLTNSTASSAMISGGTVLVFGKDIRDRPVSESINLASNGLASVQSSTGSVLFQRVETISFSNFSLATASSSASNSVSFSIGVHQIIALPISIKRTDAVPHAWIGTTPQLSSVGISDSTGSSTHSYTVRTGAAGTAGISFSNGLATNTPVMIDVFHSRAGV